MAKLFAFALIFMVAACAPRAVTAQLVDDRVVLPSQDINKSFYVRHYLLMTIVSDEDLPFTTSHSFMLSAPRDVWVGVYARTDSFWTSGPAGLEIVSRREDFPEFVHGGCEIVNVVADAHTGETLGSWCNVDNRSEDVAKRPIPYYIPAHSPLGDDW